MMGLVQKLFKATRYAFQGLRVAYHGQLAFRLECWFSVFVVPVALFFGKTSVEKSILITVWLLVLVVELLNSAIESVVNRIGAEQNVLSGQAKDMGAAAVLLVLTLALCTWVLLLF